MLTRSDWRSLLARIAHQPAILLFLDFDGTLSDITARPEDAALRPGNAALLNDLNGVPGYAVGVVSGRALADVSHRVGLPGLTYAGNHGLEIRGPNLTYLHPVAAAAVPILAQAAHRLSAALAVIPGAQVEHKTLTVTVHYRRTPGKYHQPVVAIFREAIAPLVERGLCRVTTAKSAIELRPAADWHKGRALNYIRCRLSPRAFPIYIGDDATDEDAFRSAQQAGGAGVFVGPSNALSAAQYQLDDPCAVTAALSELAAIETQRRQFR